MTGTLHTEQRGNCTVLTLDNIAKRNSLDLPLLEQLTHAASQLADAPQTAVVVLRGAGPKAFCAGADFDAMTVEPIAASVSQMDRALDGAIAALHTITVPVIAAIEGACFGGGLQIALAADIRVCNAGARFGIPAARIGLAYPFEAIEKMVRLGGAGSTNLLFLGGENFDAEHALRRRLVDEIVPDALFSARVDELARLIAACPRESARAYKQMIRSIAAADDTAARAAHRQLAEQQLFMPGLEQVVAQRAAKKPAPAD